MPHQAHLFIGQPVRDYLEIREVFGKLDVQTSGISDDELFEKSIGKTVALDYGGRKLDVQISLHWELEDGNPFPVPGTVDATTVAVAVALTGRYRGKILDGSEPHGRPDLFCFDPEEILGLLSQVRQFWPEARVFVWDRSY